MEPKQVPLKDVIVDSLAADLTKSEAMKPYREFVAAIMNNSDPSAPLAIIEALPLKDRYVWRIVSALQWAFADFDSMCIAVDRVTLQGADLTEIKRQFPLRAVQMALSLKLFFGVDGMKQIMADATKLASGEHS